MDHIPSLQKQRFADFVALFPPVKMPVTLGEDTHHLFGTENAPFPQPMIDQFLLPIDPEPADEFTEYVPCFGIEDAGPFVALVWWKAELLAYAYHLATFTPQGTLIDRRTIAFTRHEGPVVRRAVATINEDLEIFVAEGAGENDVIDPTASRTYDFEIMANGEIAG